MPHTYGPWELLKSRSINGAHIYSENARVGVARLTAKADKPIDQKEADGYLIAAAPELLKALKQVYLLATPDGSLEDMRYRAVHKDEMLAQAERAIAKAEGRNA